MDGDKPVAMGGSYADPISACDVRAAQSVASAGDPCDRIAIGTGGAMTLLRLSPDSERLRRIAKAHAAGELSTPDYRRIRAEVIERFGGDTAADHGDDTEPRWLDRPAAPTPAIKTRPIACGSRNCAAMSRSRVWWIVVVVSVIAVASVPRPRGAARLRRSNSAIRIRRPVTRFPVDHLAVRNFVAYPDLGITANRSMRCSTGALKDLDGSIATRAERIHAGGTRRDRHAAEVDGRAAGPAADDARCRAAQRVAGVAESRVAARRSWNWNRSRRN